MQASSSGATAGVSARAGSSVRAGSVVVAALALAAFAVSLRLDAQTRTTAGVRGKVVDEQGNGIAGVKLEMEFKGESRVPVTRSQTTDKKGGYVRVGLPSGRWLIVFSKDGYQPYHLETDLSAGGYSELPDVVLPLAKAAPPPEPAADEVVPVLPPESVTMKDVYNKAVEASQKGELEEAERLYREVLEKVPGVGEIHYNLGHVLVRKNDIAAAEAAFRRAAELMADRPEAAIALAGVLGSTGKTGEAADLLAEAKAKFEAHAKFQYALGTAALNAGRGGEAAAALRKALELDPATIEAHYHLASLAVGANKTAEAVAELEKYLSLSGQDPQNLATARALLAALKARK